MNTKFITEFMRQLNQSVDSASFLSKVMIDGGSDFFIQHEAKAYIGRDCLPTNVNVDDNGHGLDEESRVAILEAFILSLECVLVLPELDFFKLRCTFTWDDLLKASESEQEYTAVVSNSVFREIVCDNYLASKFDPVTQYELVGSGYLGKLGKVKVLTDAFRHPEHLVLPAEDSIFLVANDAKEKYAATKVVTCMGAAGNVLIQRIVAFEKWIR